MLKHSIVELFLKKNFRFLGCNQPDIAIFFKPRSDTGVDIFIIADHCDGHFYNTDMLSKIAYEVERKFIFSGFRDIKQQFMIISNNITNEKPLLETPLSFWLVDNNTKKLIIYENQPEDFCNLKIELEDALQKKSSSSKKSSKRKFSLYQKGYNKNITANNSTVNIPLATLLIILSNVIIFLIFEIIGSTEDASFMASHGAMSWRQVLNEGKYYLLLTSNYLHFGIEHLVNNMLTLGVLGSEAETHLGTIRFMIIYTLSGVGASIISALHSMNTAPNEYSVSAGASGAIFGIFGSLLILSLMNKTVRKKLQPLNIAIISVLCIINGMGNYEIDNVAHIAGLMFGIILTFISCLCQKNIIKCNG